MNFVRTIVCRDTREIRDYQCSLLVMQKVNSRLNTRDHEWHRRAIPESCSCA